MKKERLSGAISLVLMFIISLGALGLEGCKKTQPETQEKEAATAASAGPATPFMLVSFEGRDLSLDAMKGKTLVINFFASWCGPCKEEAPALQKAYLAFKDLGVEFIGIAVDDTEENARKFIKEYNITFPAGRDATGEISKAYKLYGIPDTFIIGKDGQFKYAHVGNITEEELMKEIRKAL